MKKYTLPFLFLLLSVAALAQPAAKTTAPKPRLVGEAHWKFLSGAYVPQDTAGYEYYADRPAEWVDGWEAWRYDRKSLSAWDASSSSYYPATVRGILNYSGSDLPTEIVVQTRPITSMVWNEDSKAIFTYDAAGNMTRATVYPWDAGAGDWRADPNGRHTYTYNASNKRTSWLYEGYNVSAGAYQNGFKFTYYYDGSGNMISMVRQNWDYTISAWVNADREVYTWDGSNNKIQTRFQSWSGSAWDNGNRHTHSGFHNHQPELTLQEGYIVSISGPIFYNSALIHTTFNADDQPVYQYEESWDSPTSTWIVESGDNVTLWYYEPYTLNIPGIAQEAKGKATVYPVPAGKEMTLDVEWDEPQAFKVAITDMQGRQRCAWSVAASKQHKENVPVSSLEPGNYTITIQGEKGKITQQITVTR